MGDTPIKLWNRPFPLVLVVIRQPFRTVCINDAPVRYGSDAVSAGGGQTAVSRLPGHADFVASVERLRQSFQDQVGRLDDALITWSQIRFERFARQVLQTNDIANGNFITLLR